MGIAIERLLYSNKQQRGQSYDPLLTNLKKLREDLLNIMGHEEIACPSCCHCFQRRRSVPEEIWGYLILRNAQTLKEEKILMMHW